MQNLNRAGRIQVYVANAVRASSTIRVSAAAKKSLEAVRRRLQEVEGRPLTQEEAAGRAFALLAAHPDLLRETPWTPTRAQKEFMASFIGAVYDPDLQTSEIDNELYGPRE
jgi:hypothetical protein